MLDPLSAAIRLAGSGLDVQSERMRVVSENLANARSTGKAPGADPYRRQTITFTSELDKAAEAMLAKVDRIGRDPSDFEVEYDPSHPAADEAGYVKMPNVNPLIEMADMREASRSYEADLQMVKQARQMIAMTIDLLKA